MAVRSVNLSQTLRPWHAAGLTHILLDRPLGDIAVFTRSEQPVSAAPAVFHNAQRDPTRVHNAAALPKISVVPLAQWPVNWRRIFEKSRSAPIVWVYSELGLDMCCTPSAKRRQLLQQLISKLHFPRGSITFWPTALPDPVDTLSLVPNPVLFFSGLEMLAPRMVVLFGQSTLDDAHIDATLLPPFQQQVFSGRLFLHAPELCKLFSSEDAVSLLLALLRATAQKLVF